MLHLLFACPNRETCNLLTFSLKLLWNAETYASWEKQSNCLKLLLLTGANSASKKNPLQSINNTPSTLLVLKQLILEIGPAIIEDERITLLQVHKLPGLMEDASNSQQLQVQF